MVFVSSSVPIIFPGWNLKRAEGGALTKRYKGIIWSNIIYDFLRLIDPSITTDRKYIFSC